MDGKELAKALDWARQYDEAWPLDTANEAAIVSRALLAVTEQRAAVRTFEEWAVRWLADGFTNIYGCDTEKDARAFIALIGTGELVRRTVTRTEWQAAADSLPGA